MNIYCFSTLSFAKLQFKSVINKAFHKHGVASFTDAWIETLFLFPGSQGAASHLLQMRGLKHKRIRWIETEEESHLLQMRGLKQPRTDRFLFHLPSHLLQMRGLKRFEGERNAYTIRSHLLQMRGLKLFDICS